MITKTKPFNHQHTAYSLLEKNPNYALLMEMGTGKSKVIIDDSANSFFRGEITALIVIAPNGVHQNWITDEIPTHLPMEPEQFLSMCWQSNDTKARIKERADFANDISKKFKIVAINAEALVTDKYQKFIAQLMKNNYCSIAVDEVNKIMKNPKAKRTKYILKLAKLFLNKIISKRILTGTPVTQSPFDMFAPFAFLDESILGFKTFTGFKYNYGIFKRMEYKGRKAFDQCVGYKNVEQLGKDIKPHSYRVLKKDCLDLPEKIFEKIYVELSTEQRKIYNKLKKEFVVEIKNKIGEVGYIESPMALTRILRLQQITGGFVPVDEIQNVRMEKFIPNPKVSMVKEIIEGLPADEKVIVWCRFVEEIKAIRGLLGNSALLYYGDVSSADRGVAKDRFQNDSEIKILIANQACAGLGLTLTAASTVIYFSNDFSFANRKQSEDRCHRIGQKKNVTYIDLVSPNTVDEKILKALRSKKDMADLITGDDIEQWI